MIWPFSPYCDGVDGLFGQTPELADVLLGHLALIDEQGIPDPELIFRYLCPVEGSAVDGDKLLQTLIDHL